MPSRCYRFILLCWLICWSWAAPAVPASNQAESAHAEQRWLKKHDELVIGMVSVDWPPYVYADGRGSFHGPLDDFAELVAGHMGLPLQYRGYPDYVRAQQGLQDGEVDLLLGVTPVQSSEERALISLDIMGVPRGILLMRSQTGSSLSAAKEWRWVCIRGFGACDELARLGMTRVEHADNADEAAVLVKRGLVDAYLADLPTLLRLQHQRQYNELLVVTPAWVPSTRLTMTLSARESGLRGLAQRVLESIPDSERWRLLETGGGIDYSKLGGPHQTLFSQEELDWLARHPTLKYGVAPHWPAVSEIDPHGKLTGFVADLLALVGERSGLHFTLVPTQNWVETIDQFSQRQLDLIPAITPTDERRELMLFTPEYAFIHRVIAARQGTPEIEGPDALRGHRVGMVAGSVEKLLLDKVGAKIVTTSSDSLLLSLLDSGQVDYVLMNVTTLEQALKRGFNDRYQVVLSGSDLRVPVAMAVHKQDPMLQQILTKALLSVRPDELARLEHKWMSLTIQTGIDPATVLLWSSLGAGIFLLCVLLFIGWNRTLRRQISQRQQAERQLSEQLTFVQTLLDSLPNMVVLRDKELRITLCNHAYRDTFIGEGDEERFHPANLPPSERERVLREEREVWRSGEMLEGAGYSRRQDGSSFHVIYAKQPYRSRNGGMLGVLTVLTDVSSIKEAEERARQAEVRLTQITDSMPGIVYQYLWIGPGKGRFLYVSQGAGEILGVSDEQMVAVDSGGELFGFTEAALQEFVGKVAYHAELLAPLDLEVKVDREEGARYLQVRGSFLRQEEGIILNGVIHDITALKQQELELREARAVAEQAMQARSRFLATMSHELRTPISGMHGMLELLQMSQLDDDQRYLLRNISTSANSLLYLVNDILDFSKMEAGQLQLHYHACRLTSVVCDVIRGHATLAYGKGLKVTLTWGPEVPDQASMDEIRVGQVLSNLLNNAVKFTEAGAIAIRVGYQDNRLQFVVQDSGIGIAADKQEHLFTPFKQVESDITRRFGGTGLGLAICHQLSQKMGGALVLESELGVGTRVTFSVPLRECQWNTPPLADQDWWWLGEDRGAQEEMAQLGARLRPLPAQGWQHLSGGRLIAEERVLEQRLGSDWQQQLQLSPLKGLVLSTKEALRSRMESDDWWRLGLSPLYPDLLLETCHQLAGQGIPRPAQLQLDKLQGRVLVADDHPVNRALLARQLAILGIEAVMVEDGEKALRTWQGQGFSLLLTDCHMPVMDGYSLTRALRAAGESSPIIGVTADASETASEQMLAAGMDDMLFKPYNLEALRQMLLRWLPGAMATSDEAEVSDPAVQDEEAPLSASHWIALFGDLAVAREMALEYLASNRQDGEEMARALARQDTQGLVEIAHRIKGAARMVGLSTLATEAAQLETVARLKQLDRLAQLCQRVETLMNGITGDIGLWLDEQYPA
ncbi:ATP-binding protein [Aeromonas veronii]|uniref:ATP-binding protein n=1 Tax=Aeromonas veronii TaxID=654 RepID=UPI0032EFBCBA